MYELFTDIVESRNSVSIPPEFRLIKDNYTLTLDNIISYYNDKTLRVKSNHRLAKILNDASIPFDYGLERYIDIAYTRAPYIARLHKLTSETNYGIIHSGVFYYNCKEIHIYVEEYIDINDLANWKRLCPVKVLKHPISDMGLTIPDGTANNTAEGLAVIAIDIAMLLVMYRKFYEESIVINPEVSVSVQQFIARYVLPNMLYSQTDISIYNRLTSAFYGKPMTESLTRHPIAHSDYTAKIDKINNWSIKRLKNRNIRYDAVLKNIPTITSIDIYRSLLMPSLAPTRQIWWALLLTRLDDMLFLKDFVGKKGIRRNSDSLSSLKVTIKHIRNDNVFYEKLDEDMYYDVENLLRELE